MKIIPGGFEGEDGPVFALDDPATGAPGLFISKDNFFIVIPRSLSAASALPATIIAVIAQSLSREGLKNAAAAFTAIGERRGGASAIQTLINEREKEMAEERRHEGEPTP